MNISIYLRVSTEDQAREGYSLDVQREYLESFAKKEGFEIFKIYNDDGYTGYNTNRPALSELLKDAREKKFNLVLVYKLDRFSRNLKDLLNLVDEFSSYGIGFKSATEPFDTTTSAGKLMFQQLGSFAEFERNRIAERVFPGMIRGVKEGNWQGARYSPYGYKYNKPEKLLEIDRKELKVVHLIYSMFLSGKSICRITEHLTRKGYRNRKGNIFTTKLIGDILKNRIYTGKLIWNVHHYDKTQKTKKGFRYIKNSADKIIISQGKHKHIISDEDFEKTQNILSHKRTIRTSKLSFYPLTGILYCARCNHKYLGFTNTSNHRTGRKKRWYRCIGPQRSFNHCKNRSIKAEVIEPQVALMVDRLLKNEKLSTNQWMNMTDSPSLSLRPSKVKIEQIKQRLKTNFEKQSKLTDIYLNNSLSEDVFKQKNEELKNEADNLKKMIAHYEMKEIEWEKSVDYLDRVDDFLSDDKTDRKEIDDLTKKQMLNLIFKNIHLADKKIKSFEFYAPFNYFYGAEEENNSWRKIHAINPLIPAARKRSISEHSVAR